MSLRLGSWLVLSEGKIELLEVKIKSFMGILQVKRWFDCFPNILL